MALLDRVVQGLVTYQRETHIPSRENPGTWMMYAPCIVHGIFETIDV